MNFQDKISIRSLLRSHVFILIQFFLIIFVYHTLKDLKDTVVITASDAGAEVIPFIKIWGMLPLAVLSSYLFSKLYNRFGRDKTLYLFAGFLLSCYALFAFFLYPLREVFHLSSLEHILQPLLPTGCKGFIAMVCYWHYTLFYITAELWSPIILSVLFWGYVNETTSLKEAKKFYPLCMLIGNVAGILSGQVSHFICHHLRDFMSWQGTLQLMICVVALSGFAIMKINHTLSLQKREILPKTPKQEKPRPTSFKENILAIFKSGPLLCIATLVVGFAATTNLIEVVWKENIRNVYPDPQAYNAYITQLTSLVGLFSVCMALLSRFIFQFFTWSKIALITPVTLFITSTIFFFSLLMPKESLGHISNLVHMTPIFLVVTLGSIHYVLGMTAKYTLFDSCKEMAFLSIDQGERMKAKSVIDSVGSRLGKSGSSCLYQLLLITFGSASGHLSIIGFTSILMIGVSIIAAKKLGQHVVKTTPDLQKAVN